MITLDQVLLLEQRVESAVKKIQQLESENDALRNECSKLKNAFAAQSEQLSSLQGDQNQIEDKIRKALDRLNSIENSVIDDSTKSTAPVFDSNPIDNRVSEAFVSGNTISSLSNQAQNQVLNEELASDYDEDSNESDAEPSEINIPIYTTRQDNFPETSTGIEENIDSFDINPNLTIQEATETQNNISNPTVTFNDMNPVVSNNMSSADTKKMTAEISESEKELGAALNPFNFEDNIQDDFNESDDQSDDLHFDIF